MLPVVESVLNQSLVDFVQGHTRRIRKPCHNAYLSRNEWADQLFIIYIIISILYKCVYRLDMHDVHLPYELWIGKSLSPSLSRRVTLKDKTVRMKSIRQYKKPVHDAERSKVKLPF